MGPAIPADIRGRMPSPRRHRTRCRPAGAVGATVLAGALLMAPGVAAAQGSSAVAGSGTGPVSLSALPMVAPPFVAAPTAARASSPAPRATCSTGTGRVRSRAAAASCFDAYPNPAQVGATVTLDATKSPAPTVGHTIVDYSWDLDGTGSYTTDTRTTPKTTHAYPVRGTVIVGLQVTDDTGASSTTSVQVDVLAPPTAQITQAPTPAVTNQPVRFDAGGSRADTGGQIVDYSWDMDGSGAFAIDTFASPSESYTFTRAGSYQVRVRVTDSAHGTAFTTVPVTVNDPPASGGSGGPGGSGAPGGSGPPGGFGSSGPPAGSGSPGTSPASPSSAGPARSGSGGSPPAWLASAAQPSAGLRPADRLAIVAGSDSYFAAITGDAVRRSSAVAAHGLWVNLVADRSVRFSLAVQVTASDARRLGLAPRTRRVRRSRRGRRPVVIANAPVLIGSASGALATAGQRPLNISFSRAARAALRRRNVTLRITVLGTATDVRGHQARVARAFMLRR